MIEFSRFVLDNGLKVIIQEDRSSPLVAMNILYDVGSKDEDPDCTGLAHLFEHLMFSGTPAVPEFDSHLQVAGGENNAYTTNDLTSYYLTLPASNIETGFWLESDRMNGLDFSQRNLDIQKNVVIEEFNQRYLNQPYGDAMLLLRPLAYRVHPYKWPTIGKNPDHIRNADLEKIKSFFFSNYYPGNAILTLAGNISSEQGIRLCEKWFGKLENRGSKKRIIRKEPEQKKERRLSVDRDIPVTALYKAWHSCGRKEPDFVALDLLTDILAGGESGRLRNTLVRGKKLFSELNTYLTSDIDPGMIIFYGRLMKNVEIERAEDAVNEVIEKLKSSVPSEKEMEKVKNKFEAANISGNTGILNKALNLSFYELLGDAEMINREVELFRKTDRGMITQAANKYLSRDNCSTLFYKSSRRSNR